MNNRQILLDKLEKCTPGEQLWFKLIYSTRELEVSISDVVNRMPDERLGPAIAQVDKTINLRSYSECKKCGKHAVHLARYSNEKWELSDCEDDASLCFECGELAAWPKDATQTGE